MGLTIARSGKVLPGQVELMRTAKKWAEDCSSGMLREMQQYAPHGSHGRIYKYFEDKDVYMGASGELSHLHGNIKELRMGKSAPRNTIADFLAWYRGARVKRASGSNPNAKQAWYRLSYREKTKLFGARLGGRFGGPYPPPTYMEAVNSGAVLDTLPSGSISWRKQARYRGFLDRVRAGTRVRVDAISQSVRV